MFKDWVLSFLFSVGFLLKESIVFDLLLLLLLAVARRWCKERESGLLLCHCLHRSLLSLLLPFVIEFASFFSVGFAERQSSFCLCIVSLV